MAAPKIAGRTSIQIDGLAELRTMLEDIAPREATNILRSAVHAVAGKVRDEMKKRVKVDSGDLKRSIYIKRRRGKPGFPVSDVRMRGTPHPHGLMLEHGTSKTKAQPFILPTVVALGPAVPTMYREQFGEKLEKSLAKQAKKGS